MQPTLGLVMFGQRQERSILSTRLTEDLEMLPVIDNNDLKKG